MTTRCDNCNASDNPKHPTHIVLWFTCPKCDNLVCDECWDEEEECCWPCSPDDKDDFEWCNHCDGRLADDEESFCSDCIQGFKQMNESLEDETE